MKKMFANHICKDTDNESSKLNSKNITQKPRQFTREVIRWKQGHLKMHTSSAMREMPVQSTVRRPYPAAGRRRGSHVRLRRQSD